MQGSGASSVCYNEGRNPVYVLSSKGVEISAIDAAAGGP
jgi:hypothetical protein